MSFGGGRTVTNETTSEPWAAAQPYILSGMGAAQNLVNSGTGQQYFPTSTVVPFSNQTETALQAMEGRAIEGSPLVGSTEDALARLMNESGPSSGYWQNVIGGDYLNSNPYLDQTYNRMADQVQSRVNAQMGLAGRTSSGAHQDLLADNLGDLANQVYGQNYQLERDRQQQAAGAYDQNMSRQIQAAAIAPMVSELGYSDIDRLLKVGGIREGMGEAQMEDLINRWNFAQQAPWDVLGQYNNIALGLGSLGSTGQTIQPTSFGQRLGGLFSGAGAGYATSTQPGSSGSGILGAVLGGLGGLFSDERLKKDIRPVFTRRDGVRFYRWTWNAAAKALGLAGEGFGVIAQELRDIRPDAVIADPSGFLKVQYGRIL